MVEIDDKIIGSDLLSARFCCDVAACKGECCVEGNSGAPLDTEEEEELKKHYTDYKQYMTCEGIAAVEAQGFAVRDWEGDLTTPLVAGAECAYAIKENGATWCAVEKAWFNGQCAFRKPISCHLYPIRLVKLANGYTGLQYHRWSVCRAAELKGAKEGIPLYVSLKDALVRRFGADFYEQLLDAVDYIEQEDALHARTNR